MATIAAMGQAGPSVLQIVDGGIPQPLTQIPGDPVAGRLIVKDTSIASCLICHEMPIAEEPDHGNIGPSLAGVGSRYVPAELRLRLVNPKTINPDTIMPAYFSVDGLNRVAQPFQGKTIYSAQQIEDVVAYLLTLTGEPGTAAP